MLNGGTGRFPRLYFKNGARAGNMVSSARASDARAMLTAGDGSILLVEGSALRFI
jgi:hypothetical protein